MQQARAEEEKKESEGKIVDLMGIVSDLIASHYQGITTVEPKQIETLRKDYAKKTRMLQGSRPPSCVEDVLAECRHDNLVRAYRAARTSANLPLIKRLNCIIDSVGASERARILEAVGTINNPAFCTAEQVPSEFATKAIERELGGGEYRFGSVSGIMSVRARLGFQVGQQYIRRVRSLAKSIGIDEALVNEKLRGLRIVTLLENGDGRFIEYCPEEHVLVLSQWALRVKRAELNFAMVKEAVYLLQHVRETSTYIKLVNELSRAAIARREMPPRTYLERLIREFVSEVIALGTVDSDEWGFLRHDTVFLMMNGVIVHMVKDKQMTVEEAVKTCLDIGCSWVEREPVVIGSVPGVGELLCASRPSLAISLRSAADRLLRGMDFNFVVNLVWETLAFTGADASPFKWATEDFREHLRKDLHDACRTDLNSFVGAYREYMVSDRNPDKILAHSILALSANGLPVLKKGVLWAKGCLAEKKRRRKLKFSQIFKGRVADVFEYIDCCLVDEYARRRKLLNEFKVAFVGSSPQGRAVEIQTEMFLDGDEPVVRRWNALVKSLGLKKNSKGLPILDALVEKLRIDGVTVRLVEDGTGQHLVEKVGRFASKGAIQKYLEAHDRGKRGLTIEEKKCFLATSILNLMYATPEIAGAGAEDRLGVFMAIYLDTEGDVLPTR